MENTIEAINNYDIAGFSTTLGFCRFAIDHPEFRNGNFTINFVGEHYKPEMLRQEVSTDVAKAAYAIFKKERKEQEPKAIPTTLTDWGLKR
jgi:propionyl-CoA carboxylase alpha chain